jgi:hypothetical protein
MIALGENLEATGLLYLDGREDLVESEKPSTK